MKKYGVIYADPAWSYNDKRADGLGGAENHYPTMKLNDIKALKVAEIAAEPGLLFLWVTFPLLKEGIEVVEAWGFKYKTLGFAWIKTNPRQQMKQRIFGFVDEEIDDFFGIGAYTKSNCEVCLIGTKGRGASLVVDNSVASTIISQRQRHSRKPATAVDRIEKLVGGRG